MKFVVALIVALLFTISFRLASGSLSINKLNTISLAFYYILFFNMIGGTLLYLGYRDRVIAMYVSENGVAKTYYVLAYSAIMFPLITAFFTGKIRKRNWASERYQAQLFPSFSLSDGFKQQSKNVFQVFLIITMVCTLVAVYTFAEIGYIPLFKVLFSRGYSFATERILIKNSFSGIEEIRNLFFLQLAPIISFVSYAYMRTTKSKSWKYLFVFSLLLTVLAKTYDFEKAPLVVYVIFLFFTEIQLGTKFSMTKIIRIGILVVTLIVFFYIVIGGYDGKWFTISSGPLGRILITTDRTLCLHLDCFPNKVSYLSGRSFPGWIGFIFGHSDWGIRSGKIVMEIYFPSNVSRGIAGVASTWFAGEAYANWGWIGVAFSPFVVGLVFSVIQNYYEKSNRYPLDIAYYVSMSSICINMLESGFINYIYSSTIIFIVLLFRCVRLFDTNKGVREPLRSKGYQN